MLVVLPILVPLLTAAVSLLAWKSRAWQRRLGLVGAVLLLAASVTLLAAVRRGGIQTSQMGDWPAPFGITLVADHFSAIMVVLTGIIGLAVAVYSRANIDAARQSFAYFPLYHVMLMGVSAAFLTGDIFNLYVWFEVLLIASFVLLALGGERAQLEGAVKYVTLNLVSSFLFLTGVGILYGAVGTLNMADVARQLARLERPDLITTVSMLFLVAFGIKAAVFPLFFWLPASYHTPPAAVSAVFAGLLTKVGVYAMIRVFTLIFVQYTEFTHTLILIISGLTMVTGVLGAVAQSEFRRILSFHIVSQIGYMILGLGLFTPLGLAGAVFYIAHHIIVKTNLFLVSGVVHALGGSYKLKELGGVCRDAPALSLLFAIPALSLAGLPPLSGFIAKLILVRAGLEAGQYTIVATAVIVSLLTLFSMAKIWNAVFWGPPPEHAGVSGEFEPGRVAPRPARHGPAPTHRLTGAETGFLMGPIVALALMTVLIGLAAGPLFAIAQAAGEELWNPKGYIEKVLDSE